MSASSLCCPNWPIQTVLTYTDDARRHFSSPSHPIKARLSVLRPPHKDEPPGAPGIERLATKGAIGQAEP
jgi:hypothetical protein